MGTISLQKAGERRGGEEKCVTRVSVFENGDEIPTEVVAALLPEDCEDKMSKTIHHCTPDDEDGLRLLALSRIPQCTTCPRLAGMMANHRIGSGRPIPGPPAACTYRYCAPLARRYGRLEVEFSLDAPSALATTERENVGLRRALLESEALR
jgi:hypothetical protein